jgi:hypothetical protein
MKAASSCGVKLPIPGNSACPETTEYTNLANSMKELGVKLVAHSPNVQ